MKKIHWKDKLRYLFDNLMSQGMLSLIALLFGGTVLVVTISGLLIALVDEETGLAIPQSMWVSLMHAIDAGTLAADEGDFLFILVMSAVTVCGLFITSTLISIINTGLEDS